MFKSEEKGNPKTQVPTPNLKHPALDNGVSSVLAEVLMAEPRTMPKRFNMENWGANTEIGVPGLRRKPL